MGLSPLLVFLYFAWLAFLLPWTRAAVAAWLVCLVVSLVPTVTPWPFRALLAPMALGWLPVQSIPGRSADDVARGLGSASAEGLGLTVDRMTFVQAP